MKVASLGEFRQRPELFDAKTDSQLRHSVPDVTILRHVGCCRVVLFGTNQPILRVAFPKLRVGRLAEPAVSPSASVLVRSTMKNDP